MIKRTAYQCEYCGKIALTKKTIANHEPACFNNPERKACAICTHPYYLVDRNNPEDKKRLCKKGHDISRSLTADCLDFKWAKEAGSWGFYTEFLN